MSARGAVLTAFAILAATAVLMAPVACTMRKQDAVVQAIKAGADPIEAKCALDQLTDSEPVCVIAASRGRK